MRQCLLSPDILTTGGVHKKKMYRNVGNVRMKNCTKIVGSVPMKVGWVSKYDTSIIQCP